jgi:hypothetical protein
MKYVLSLVIGLLAGVAAAAALIYFNPLTRSQHAPASDSAWVLGYSLAASDTWLSTHNDRFDLPLVPKDVSLLWESGIKGSLLAAMPLKAEGSSVSAAASRISVPSSRTEFLRAGLLVEDYWLISVPGEGSVLVHAVNNQWPLLRDTVVRVDWLQRDFAGPGEYGPTMGPNATGAELIGLTGAFAGARGRGRERVTLDRYDGNLARVSGQLLLDVAAARL